FSDVVIHCQVQAADGRRMSKSLGTGVDPRDLITKYGTDALRAWAASVAMWSQDVRFDETRVEGYRRVCNKLWNATRLILGSPGTPPAESPGMLEAREHLEDRWILSRLSVARRDVTAGIDGFAFQDSINAAYGFAWNEFCDWYLESIKERLRAVGSFTSRASTVRWRGSPLAWGRSSWCRRWIAVCLSRLLRAASRFLRARATRGGRRRSSASRRTWPRSQPSSRTLICRPRRLPRWWQTSRSARLRSAKPSTGSETKPAKPSQLS